MIKSMTGHGGIEKSFDFGILAIEMRSVNSRYLDIFLKAPDFLELYKNDFNKILSERLVRGRISVFIKFESNAKDTFCVNFDAAEKIFHDLERLRKNLAIDEPVTMTHLLEIPEVLKEKEPEIDMEILMDKVVKMLAETAQKLDDMRSIEGKNLADGIEMKLQEIERNLKEITNRIADRKISYFQKYKDLIRELSGDINIDGERLLQEVAIMTKKVDITEECDRIVSHISQFRNYMDKDDDAGKKMNFLVQEINREMTTIGSKAESAEISQLVVNMKNELEKIREQVQNIL
ncbi:MAG: YicC family protein [Candidatus Marinimicrobia bacterium]|nr:YicC family protein [Candidatus Neomarinimicrobiota bacterium]